MEGGIVRNNRLGRSPGSRTRDKFVNQEFQSFTSDNIDFVKKATAT